MQVPHKGLERQAIGMDFVDASQLACASFQIISFVQCSALPTGRFPSINRRESPSVKRQNHPTDLLNITQASEDADV
jgi:hypothetical protein